MTSNIHTFIYKNGEIQKVQEVKLDSFDNLNIFRPVYNKKSFDNLCDLYRDFIIPKYINIFGKIILFTLPKDIEIPFSDEDEEYGKLYDTLTVCTVAFKRNISIKNGVLIFKNKKTENFYKKLERDGYLYLAKGNRNSVSVMPVSRNLGFMSESQNEALLKVNSSFFVMDKFDCATLYDQVGTGIGLEIKNGIIYNPPMFDRETLIVDEDDKVSIRKTSMNDVSVLIDDVEYKNDVNCRFITRPNYRKSIKGGVDIVVNNNKVTAVKCGGNTPVPAGGYIIHLDDKKNVDIKNKEVKYSGFEDVKFAIQVGNSVINNGFKTDRFISPFYSIAKFWIPSYPPSMYPLKYDKDRAPRIVLGSDKENKPVLLWFEGAGKFGYMPGKESCGATMKETADIAEKLGLVNAVHLDGGGSAQILINDKRELLLSDRDKETFKEKERAISFGLYYKE